MQSFWHLQCAYRLVRSSVNMLSQTITLRGFFARHESVRDVISHLLLFATFAGQQFSFTVRLEVQIHYYKDEHIVNLMIVAAWKEE